jgi:hypothetical protein
MPAPTDPGRAGAVVLAVVGTRAVELAVAALVVVVAITVMLVAVDAAATAPVVRISTTSCGPVTPLSRLA